MRAIDPAYAGLAAELRAARPRSSDDLRRRVLGLATAPAPPRRLPSRRFALAAAPALAAVAALAVGLGVVTGRDAAQPLTAERGIPTTGAGQEGGAVRGPALLPGANHGLVATGKTPHGAWTSADGTRSLGRLQGAPVRGPFPVPGGRMQDYRADLTVRVRSIGDLGSATTEAMRVARSLGGYVVRADFGAAGRSEGDSSLVIRVPVDKARAAVLRLAGLGVVEAQQVSMTDLQAGYDRRAARVASLRRTIAGLRDELARTDLTFEQRELVRARLERARTELGPLVRAQRETARRASLATVSLTLTTRHEEAVPAPPGRFERTLRDALGILALSLTWLLAALVVAGPFALLLALAALLGRRHRRRADQRLLDAAA